MNEYKIKYEALPISEVIREKVIEAPTLELACSAFREFYKIKGEILSIKLVVRNKGE